MSNTARASIYVPDTVTELQLAYAVAGLASAGRRLQQVDLLRDTTLASKNNWLVSATEVWKVLKEDDIIRLLTHHDVCGFLHKNGANTSPEYTDVALELDRRVPKQKLVEVWNQIENNYTRGVYAKQSQLGILKTWVDGQIKKLEEHAHMLANVHTGTKVYVIAKCYQHIKTTELWKCMFETWEHFVRYVGRHELPAVDGWVQCVEVHTQMMKDTRCARVPNNMVILAALHKVPENQRVEVWNNAYVGYSGRVNQPTESVAAELVQRIRRFADIIRPVGIGDKVQTLLSAIGESVKQLNAEDTELLLGVADTLQQVSDNLTAVAEKRRNSARKQELESKLAKLRAQMEGLQPSLDECLAELEKLNSNGC